MNERKPYNIYLDESRIDNPEDSYMVIGGIFVQREKVRKIQGKIKELREEHSFFEEIKWSNTNDRKEAFLKDLTSFLLEQLPAEDLSFHCIVVQKEEVDYEKYHGNDRELAFFKFIYELLKQRMLNNTQYYIFLDYKPTKVRERVRKLEEYLEKYIYFNNQNTLIKHCQAYPSHENVFIQLADFFAGAVGYHYNNYPVDTAKDRVAKIVARPTGHETLRFASPRGEDKFNVFKISLGS